MTSLSGFGAFDALAHSAASTAPLAPPAATSARAWFDSAGGAQPATLRGEVEAAARGLDAGAHAQRVLACLVDGAAR